MDIFNSIKDFFNQISETQKALGVVATLVTVIWGKDFFDFLLRNWSKESAFKKWLSSILSGVLLIVFLVIITYLNIVIENIDYILYLCLICGIVYLLFKNRKLKLKIKVNQQQYGQTNTPTPTFKRFEEVFKRKELTYGFVQYRPFFWKDHITAKGIGYDLLDKIFYSKVKLKQYAYNKGKDGGNWDDILSDLENKKFDIIITPLFETRTRIHKYSVAYCSPLFYSNIGVYVRSKDFSNGKLTFEEGKKFLQDKIDKSNWKPEILKGELSEQLIQKHFSKVKPEDTLTEKVNPATDDDFTKVLQNVNSDNTDTGQFAFMEVFKANSIINKLSGTDDKLDLINILADNQLLYPVSFVVRKEDTVLRNLINIRLLEMRNTLDENEKRKGNEISELEKAIKDIATSSDVQIGEEDFANIFIQKYDFSNIIPA